MSKDNTQILNGLNLQVLGVGHLGKVKSIDQPDVSFEVVDDVSTGRLKAMYMTIKLGEYNPSILLQALQNNLRASSRVPFVVKGSIRQNSRDLPLMIVATGETHEIKDGSLEANKDVGREMKIKLDTYTKTVDGVPEIVFDDPNEIFLLNGVDQYAEFRANVL